MMKIFITIFFVWVFTIDGFAIEPNKVKLQDNKIGNVFIKCCWNKQFQIPGFVFNEQDSDDLDTPVIFCAQVTAQPNSVVWKFQHYQNIYFLFYQICFSTWLIDLPPPQTSFI